LSWAIQELADAIAAGARVRGYHAWSSHDNLQYMAGFTQRFGLIHVDPNTLVRTPKASFGWYREVVRDGVVPPTGTVTATPVGDHTGIDVPGVLNARGIGGLETMDGRRVRDGLVFRSAGLHGITDDGRRVLSELGVQTILDLRGATEVARRPDEIDEARVVHLPLHEPTDPDAGALLGAAADSLGTHPMGAHPLGEVYQEIVRLRGGEIVSGLRTIASTDGAVLAHCTAGKDRTGVFIAVLLAALGVRDDEIVRTYAESSERLGEEFRSEVSALLRPASSQAPDIADTALDELLASPGILITEVLETIRREHGTVVAYLGTLGFSLADVDELRRKLVA
jgi:protein tyrosine/serine phosphatase